MLMRVQGATGPSALLATLSHELKTPLVALLGFAQLLESDRVQPLTSGQRERAERIEAASRQMLSVVNDILGEARRDARVDRRPA